MKALICTAVWGDEYVERFLNYSLRTQLSAQNLGALPSGSLFLLITGRSDLDRIESSPVFRELQRLMAVECISIESIKSPRRGDKYATLSSCHNYCLQRSKDFDVVFFGYADAIWADSSYRIAMERIAEGYDAVFAMGYPVVDGPLKALIDQTGEASATIAVSLPTRRLAGAIYEHLHPMGRAANWRRKWLGHCPSYVSWDIPDQGLLLRSFHLHPVVLRVHKDPEFYRPFATTLDEEFVARLYRWNPRSYVCRTSDEFCVCGIAEDSDQSFDMQPLRAPNAGDVAAFAERHAGLIHRELFRQPIRLVVDDVCEERWESAEQEAAALAQEIDLRLATPDVLLALEFPAAYDARARRQATFNDISPHTAQPWRAMIRPLLSPRRLVRSAMRAILRVLYALRITRTVRLLIFPLLSPEQRQWCYAYIRGITSGSRLIAWPQRITRRREKMGFWQWLRRWIRAHA